MKLNKLSLAIAITALGVSTLGFAGKASAGPAVSNSVQTQLQLIVAPAYANVEAKGTQTSGSWSGVTVSGIQNITAAAAPALNGTFTASAIDPEGSYNLGAYTADTKSAVSLTNTTPIVLPVYGIAKVGLGGVAGTLNGTVTSPGTGGVATGAGDVGTTGVLTMSQDLTVFTE